MRRPFLMMGIAVLTVGCESLRPAAPAPQSAPTPNAPPRVAAKQVEVPKSPVEVVRTAASQPDPAPAPQAPTEDDSLVLVAKCLERDDLRGAATHLNTYVRAHPDQPLFRLQLAGLCLRCDRAEEARFHYERFAIDAQGGHAALRPHLVTAHIKLMELAQRGDDRFGELFHRGVGLLLLVKQLDADKDRDEVFCEEMLCKALKALRDAKELKPGEPRVRVYLADVYDRTGNSRAASAERAAARASVTGGELTATERGLE